MSFIPYKKNEDGTFTPIYGAVLADDIYVDTIGGTPLREKIAFSDVFYNQEIGPFTYDATNERYQYVYNNDIVTDKSIVIIDFTDVESYEISVECGMYPVTTEGDGTITIYAAEEPSANMRVDITIQNK